MITESDYIYYLANLYDKDRGMPGFFRKTWMPYCTLLFLGYSLGDWNDHDEEYRRQQNRS